MAGRKDWRTWSGRAAFGFSVLALLGTTDPKWRVDAKVNGPDRTPTDDQALKVTVESSKGAGIFRRTKQGQRVYAGSCARQWQTDKHTTECLLPPGSRIDGVFITGGCSSNNRGGCCDDRCPPPSEEFLSVRTDAVPIWKKT